MSNMDSKTNLLFDADYPWHLILGGQGSVDPTTASVELYNWQTGEQCQLPDLPYNITAHTGTVLDGVPVFCGGYTGLESNPVENKCYKMDMNDKSWIQVFISFAFLINFWTAHSRKNLLKRKPHSCLHHVHSLWYPHS